MIGPAPKRGMFNLPDRHYEEIPDLKQLEAKQLDLWQRILGTSITEGDRFCNPWRDDKSPDCYLEDRGGRLRMRDWADCYAYGCQWHGKDIFAILMDINNCGFNRALQIAYYEILAEKNPIIKKHINKVKPKFEKGAPIISLRYETRQWNAEDRKYWATDTGITSGLLERLGVIPISSFWVSRNMGMYKKQKCRTLTYALLVTGKVKIYQPETRLFLSEHTPDDVGSFHVASYLRTSTLLISKNVKSIATIISNLTMSPELNKTNLGFAWMHNEGGIPNQEVIENWFYMYNEIYILFDNDEAGLRASKKLADEINDIAKLQLSPSWRGAHNINFNTDYNELRYKDSFGNDKPVQDAFDMCKYFGRQRMINELEKLMIC